MWRDLPPILPLVEPVLQLVIDRVSVVFLSEDTVCCGGTHDRSTCIEVTLPVFLHYSVHDMALHNHESIKMLQIVQCCFVHQVNLCDLVLHLLRFE